MKYSFGMIVILLLAISCSTTPGPTLPNDDPSLPHTINILGRTLRLQESHGGPGSFIAEYIPANETFENWTLMFAIRVVVGKGLSPEAHAQATAQEVLKQKRLGDPVANALLLKNEGETGKSYIVDFMASKNFPQIIEHNIWLYFETAKGIASFQIARRIYSPSKSTMEKFTRGIRADRVKYIEEVTRKDLPIPSFAK